MKDRHYKTPPNSFELSRRSFLASSLLALPAVTLAANSNTKSEQNWPGFRGPGAQGIADGYPTRAAWNADASVGKVSGMLWRAEIPGLGHSSPIIWGDRFMSVLPFGCQAKRLCESATTGMSNRPRTMMNRSG